MASHSVPRPAANALSKRSAPKGYRRAFSIVSNVHRPASNRSAFPSPGGVFVYILACPDGALYVGSAKDVSRRTRLHQAGRGAKFTHDHAVGKIVYVEGPFDLTEAVRREFQLKRWSHAKKRAFIRGDRSLLKILSQSRD
jgi:putative endonuclease